MKRSNFFTDIRLCMYSIFLASYTFLFYTEFSRENNFSNVFTLLKGFIVLLMIFSIFFQKYSLKEILLFSSAFLFCAMATLRSGVADPIITFGIILSMKEVDFRKIILVDFWVRLLSTLVITFLSIIQFIPSNNFYSGAKLGFLRHSFGFFHPNTFGAYIMILTLEFIFLGIKQGNESLRIFVIPVAVIFLEAVSNNRTVELSLIIYFLAYFIFTQKFLKKASFRTYKLTAIFSLGIATLFSLMMAYMYNAGDTIWITINKVLSNRPRMISSIVNGVYPVNMFGQKTPLIGSQDGINLNGFNIVTFVDNSYIGILIKYGIVFFVLFILWFLINSLGHMHGRQRVVMLCWFIAMVAWGVSEDKLLAIQFNILLFGYTKWIPDEEKTKIQIEG
ncbi:hypothetical protein ACSAHR_02660 [Pediococcus pentosaceus]|uniref:hypothetical protein n=1 Tax=Pediococcus pentosaceus TaxID=1255 RepID=UPI003F1F12FC